MEKAGNQKTTKGYRERGRSGENTQLEIQRVTNDLATEQYNNVNAQLNISDIAARVDPPADEITGVL